MIKSEVPKKKRVDALLVFLKEMPSDAARETFAAKIPTTLANLYSIGYGGAVSGKMARRIAECANNNVTPSDLRPDIFAPLSNDSSLVDGKADEYVQKVAS